MRRSSTNSGIIGATLIGLGCGLTAVGIAMVIPACAGWSLGFLDQAVKKGREGAGTAAEIFGDVAGKAHHHFNEASKTAKATAAKAAGAVEDVARQARQYAS
ncbi:MAG TPA: hypothetical protein VK604_18465 [Bryobacteraceae bacterium]|nr:hypothetical protein [Bryobacteraceae bacterium]